MVYENKADISLLWGALRGSTNALCYLTSTICKDIRIKIHYIAYQEKIDYLSTFGKDMVIGTVIRAKTLMTFFIVAPAGLPSIPSCILHCGKATGWGVGRNKQ